MRPWRRDAIGTPLEDCLNAANAVTPTRPVLLPLPGHAPATTPTLPAALPARPPAAPAASVGPPPPGSAPTSSASWPTLSPAEEPRAMGRRPAAGGSTRRTMSSWEGSRLTMAAGRRWEEPSAAVSDTSTCGRWVGDIWEVRALNKLALRERRVRPGACLCPVQAAATCPGVELLTGRYTKAAAQPAAAVPAGRQVNDLLFKTREWGCTRHCRLPAASVPAACSHAWPASAAVSRSILTPAAVPSGTSPPHPCYAYPAPAPPWHHPPGPRQRGSDAAPG